MLFRSDEVSNQTLTAKSATFQIGSERDHCLPALQDLEKDSLHVMAVDQVAHLVIRRVASSVAIHRVGVKVPEDKTDLDLHDLHLLNVYPQLPRTILNGAHV